MSISFCNGYYIVRSSFNFFFWFKSFTYGASAMKIVLYSPASIAYILRALDNQIFLWENQWDHIFYAKTPLLQAISELEFFSPKLFILK